MSENLRFCPACAGALEPREIPLASGVHPQCVTCGFVIWQNAKVSAEALITRGEADATEVLLGRKVDEPKTWDAPGGFINAGDTIEQTLLRECQSEMGVDVRLRALVGAYDEQFHGTQIVTLVYACDLVAGDPRPAYPIDDVRWFPLTALPPIAYACIAKALRELAPADFRLQTPAP